MYIYIYVELCGGSARNHSIHMLSTALSHIHPCSLKRDKLWAKSWCRAPTRLTDDTIPETKRPKSAWRNLIYLVLHVRKQIIDG